MDGLLRWLHPGSQRGAVARLRWALLLALLAGRNAGSLWSAPGAIARLWMWQYRRRCVPAAVVSLPVGGELTVPATNQNSGMLVATGFTERGDQLLVARLVGPASVLVDVGANIGLYSVAAATAGATVTAFEPVPSTNIQLAKNLATFPAATVRPVAVGERAGRARMDGTGVGATLNDERGVDVDVVRLDDESLVSGDVTILKVDAEGRDLAVLRGAASFLASALPVVVVEVWHGGREIREYLATLGFRAHHTTRRGDLLIVDDDFAGDGNLVFIHSDVSARVAERLAAPFHLSRLTVRYPRVVA